MQVSLITPEQLELYQRWGVVYDRLKEYQEELAAAKGLEAEGIWSLFIRGAEEELALIDQQIKKLTVWQEM